MKLMLTYYDDRGRPRWFTVSTWEQVERDRVTLEHLMGCTCIQVSVVVLEAPE